MGKAIRLILVRHGEAAAKWGESKDPGLSELGHSQALEISSKITEQCEPLKLFSSPMKRAIETAHPFEEKWQCRMTVIPELIEIPSHQIPVEERRVWLSKLKQEKWPAQPQLLQNWRKGIIDFLHSRTEDSLMTTHFAVINTVVAEAMGIEDIFSFEPANCSATIVEVSRGSLRLVDKGIEARTIINL